MHMNKFELYSKVFTLSENPQYTWLLIITSANVDRFSKFFHWDILKETITIAGSSASP